MGRIINTLFVITLLVIFGVLGISCSENQDTNTAKYVSEINKWHQERIQSLKEEDSWLSLAGLYKIEEGTHSVGSDSTNDIVFPPKATANIGAITREDNNVSMEIRSGVNVRYDGKKISDITLKTDAKGEPTKLRHKGLVWYIVERRGNYYIRLKDTNHPNFASFDGIDRFPVSKKWRVEATFKQFDKPQPITLPDELNIGMQDTLYGRLEFSIDGKKYSIAPLGHPDKEEEFFIIFGDQTNGETTYDAGRYIYIPTPDENGITYIDFNKAYNPPCVFTKYATCPFPPPQNRLVLKITAGEKNYEK